ncbi:MAG TPA: ParB N-terminal domain-containing protein, partial [Gemmiger qucibialis]|nr:ParB N-terminal domain-containing protein [Gemmiger qucibialis]
MASKLDRLQKKGFKVNEAALSKIARGDQEPGGEYSEININDIEENPDNALYRELDTEEDIALLADDIRRAGLLHNLVVFPKTGVGGKYVLLSGERRLRALRLLVEQDKREQEEKQLPNRMSEWQKVQCKVVRNLTENEKVVYIDSANLQVRGGISNERVMRQAAARFVENLQKAPYNLSAAEAKKALKEVSPLNSRTIDKALSIQNDLNPDLRRLLDEEFLNRAECETYLRLTLEEQARAAAVFLKIAALDPRSHERRAIKDALTTAMLDVAVERRSMQERESVFAAALQNAQDAIGQAKTQENKAAAVDKDHNFISAKLPTTARKLRKIAAAKNIEVKIRSYTA